MDEAAVCAIAAVVEEVPADARPAGADVREVAVDGVASSALPVPADWTLVELRGTGGTWAWVVCGHVVGSWG